MNLKNLKTLYPKAKEGIFDVLEKELDKVSWTKDNKIHFLAQCSHESGGFRVLVENLNYSEQALLKVFGKYFNQTTAKTYARKPNEIADIVYANRMGNGDVSTHDGSKFKGRGLIQLTGRTNYTKLGHQEDPQYLETTEGAVKSAIWFWQTNGLDKLTDIKQITKRVNGGYNGLEDRKAQFNLISKALKD